MSHFIHATDYVLGQSYLMSSSWLHKCLTDVDDVDDTEEMLAKYAGESTKEDIFTENIPSSICIPVFIANKEIEECSTSHEKKSGYGINETKKVHLCGINIVCDPFAGHLAVYRSYSGDITTINLSVHTKLCELEANIAVSNCLTRNLLLY